MCKRHNCKIIETGKILVRKTHTETAAVSFKNRQNGAEIKSQHKSSTCCKHVHCTPTSASRL